MKQILREIYTYNNLLKKIIAYDVAWWVEYLPSKPQALGSILQRLLNLGWWHTGLESQLLQKKEQKFSTTQGLSQLIHQLQETLSQNQYGTKTRLLIFL